MTGQTCVGDVGRVTSQRSDGRKRPCNPKTQAQSGETKEDDERKEAQCGVNLPGEELSACREGGAERSKRSSEACRPSPVARKADLLVEVCPVLPSSVLIFKFLMWSKVATLIEEMKMSISDIVSNVQELRLRNCLGDPKELWNLHSCLHRHDQAPVVEQQRMSSSSPRTGSVGTRRSSE